MDTDKVHVAVVGSRKASSYGREVTEKIVSGLSRAGVVIVSGLALGVDAIAHRAALEAGGKTIAVQACGLDRIYPATNRDLAKQILENSGSIISEYEVGVPPMKQNFPARNRIVSGLCRAVIVTEAADRSGSLITASFALEQNREVCAVPGNIDAPMSAGCNQLLKAGAHLVTNAEDILNILGIEPSEALEDIAPQIENVNEAQIYQLILEGTGDSELLAQETGLDGGTLNQALTMLELNGHIKNVGGGRWRSTN